MHQRSAWPSPELVVCWDLLGNGPNLLSLTSLSLSRPGELCIRYGAWHPHDGRQLGLDGRKDRGHKAPSLPRL